MARISISQDGAWAGDGVLVRDGSRIYIEDCPAILGPRHLEGEAAQDYAEQIYEAIEEAIERGEDSLELDGIVYSWEVETPTIEVIGLGDDDWTEEADGEEREGAADAREWERYGTVRVRIGDVTYEVGAVIGVPEHLRGTARAAGGDTTTPYLAAWFADASDYLSAPGDDGSTGIPSDLADEVRAEIQVAARRLWAEYQAEVAGE